MGAALSVPHVTAPHPAVNTVGALGTPEVQAVMEDVCTSYNVACKFPIDFNSSQVF